ncbi:MAG: ABC transporter ATP-binding protein [Simkaniaceae bacterium]|nr:ABC transporter ATP-binding protein [Simkaniaceae bacterium]
MKKEPAVVLDKIEKSFGEKGIRYPVLEGSDLRIERGELLIIAGPSGSGKTTLLSILTGILRPDSGRVTLFGTDFFGLPSDRQAPFRGKYVGYVFQSSHLIPTLSTLENTMLPLLIAGVKRNRATGPASERLGQFGLTTQASLSPALLSGGERQRVAIARATVHAPELIVCDEPTSALDPENGKRVLEYLRGIASEEAKTVVIVTHDTRIFPFADRVVRLEGGKIG